MSLVLVNVVFRGVARAKKVGGINENFGHTLYFFLEDLQLLPPHTYFLIDFKEISSTILAKGGVVNKSLSLVPREGVSNETTANIANET